MEEENLRAEFFHNGDRNSLMAAVERMLADPSLRTAQAHHNYQIATRMTLEDTCRAYLRAFELAWATHQSKARAQTAPADRGQASHGIRFRNQESG
jgi:hypothetical protein